MSIVVIPFFNINKMSGKDVIIIIYSHEKMVKKIYVKENSEINDQKKCIFALIRSEIDSPTIIVDSSHTNHRMF